MIPGPNWARRYRSEHVRSCARPGCGAPAVATLRFQPTRREALLVDLEDSRGRTEGDVCTRHAASLVLPRGWSLYDQRRADATLTPLQPRARTAARPELVIVPEPVAQRSSDTVAQPEAESVDAGSAPQPAAEPTPVETLGELLDARTPLLRRAFQNVMPAGDQ